VGIGVNYVNTQCKMPFFLNGEFAYGNSYYDGATQTGDELSAKQDNVRILTLTAGLFVYDPLYVGVGYRSWNRGKSNYEGDYNEVYSWPFLTFGVSKSFEVYNNLTVNLNAAYQYAVNPKIDIQILDGTTLALGRTDGYKLQLKTKYKIKEDTYITAFYRYQQWHIKKSDTGLLVDNYQAYPIYEPESYTRNQYLGVGVLYKF
jgi:hypothetical protein